MDPFTVSAVTLLFVVINYCSTAVATFEKSKSLAADNIHFEYDEKW